MARPWIPTNNGWHGERVGNCHFIYLSVHFFMTNFAIVILMNLFSLTLVVQLLRNSTSFLLIYVQVSFLWLEIKSRRALYEISNLIIRNQKIIKWIHRMKNLITYHFPPPALTYFDCALIERLYCELRKPNLEKEKLISLPRRKTVSCEWYWRNWELNSSSSFSVSFLQM